MKKALFVLLITLVSCSEKSTDCSQIIIMAENDFIPTHLILFSIGSFFLLHCCYLIYKSLKTKKWTQVKGEILEKGVETIHSGLENKGLLYKIKIEYQYTIKNVKYVSHRAFYGDKIRLGIPYWAKKVIKQFNLKDDIIVYYNPINPKESVLQRGVNFILYVELLIAFLFIIASLYLLFNPIK